MSVANRFILAGIVYGLIGMVLGVVMGASNNFTMAPVHAHINLLGWVFMALFGLVYRAIPAMAAEKLIGVQFWLHNVGLIVMAITLSMLLKGNESIAPLLAIAELLLVVSAVIFAWLMWKHRNA